MCPLLAGWGWFQLEELPTSVVCCPDFPTFSKVKKPFYISQIVGAWKTIERDVDVN